MQLRTALIRIGGLWVGANLLAILWLNRDFPGVPITTGLIGMLLASVVLLLAAESAIATTAVAVIKTVFRGGGKMRFVRAAALLMTACAITAGILASLISWNLYCHGFGFITGSTFLSTAGDLTEIGPFLTGREMFDLLAAFMTAAAISFFVIRSVPAPPVGQILRLAAAIVIMFGASGLMLRLAPGQVAGSSASARVEAVFQARTFPGAMLWWHDLLFYQLGGPDPVSVPLESRYELDQYLATVDSSRPRKNVLIFSIESLRGEELFNAPGGSEVLPEMNRLAKDGLFFSRAIAPGNESLYSMTAVVSGLECLKFRRRDKFNTLDYPLNRIYDLASKTHRTAFISSSNEEWQGMINITNSPRLGYFFNANNFHGAGLPVTQADTGMYQAVKKGKLRNSTLDDSITTDELLKWIDSAGDGTDHRPFFATVVFQSSHYPYQQGFSVPERFSPAELTSDEISTLSFFEYPEALNSKMLNRYRNGLAFDDSLIGKIIDRLRHIGELERTVIVIFGDHGEMFHENGTVTHAAKLYDMTLRPVFLIYGLDGANKGEFSKPVALIDLGPILLEELGLPPYGGFQGQVPDGLFTKTDPVPDSIRPLFSTVQNVVYQDSVTAGRWKYTSEALGPGEQLFNLERDPLEKQSLISAKPAVAQCLRATLNDFRRNQLTYYGSKELKEKFFAPKTRLSAAWCDQSQLKQE